MNKTKRLLLATVVLVAQLPALAQTPFVPNEPHYIPRTNYSLSNGVAGAASGTNLAPDIKYFTSPRNGRVLFIQNNEPAPASAKAQVSLPVGRTNPAAIVQRAELHRPGHRSLPGVSNAVAMADRFLAQHGAALGSRRPAEELTAQWVETDGLGMTHAHYLQRYRGVPVFGAEASVHLDRQGVVRSAGGYLAPGLAVDTVPLLTTNDAVARATGYWFGQFPQGTAPETARTKLYVLAMDVVRHDGDPSVYLVWEVELSIDCPDHACEYYYMDAHSGELRLQLTGTQQLNRQIYDCSAVPGSGYCWIDYHNSLLNYDFGRSEGKPVRGPNPRYPGQNSCDVDNLYDVYFPAIMNYYQTNFARNGGNDRGGLGDGVRKDYGVTTAYTYVEFLPSFSNDCAVAKFNQYAVVFSGCSLTNDSFGHEYGHAVTYSSHLDGAGHFIGMVYQGESGALNENWADIAGEMFEVARTGNCDWTVSIEAFMRSLSDPSRSTQYHYDDGVVIYADRYYSPHFYCGTNHDDGGVHFIGTVPTKAAYLLAEGGKFNGCTIQAMGKAVMNQIWYRALTQYYSTTETFNGAYYKLLQASSDLYGADSETTRQLRRALQSVELDQAGLCSGLPPRPPEAVDVEGF